MNQTLKKVSDQITEFWSELDKKQKIKLIVVSVSVLLALTILIFILNKPKMVILSNDITPEEAADIRGIFLESNIVHEISDDGTVIKVDSKQLSEANLALAENGITSTGFTYEDAFNSSFSTTESEKQIKYNLAFKNELEDHLRTINGIDDVKLSLVVPDKNTTIFDENKEAKASIILTTKNDLSVETIEGVVSYVAGSVDNLSKENISVIDHRGRVLFNGSTVNDELNTLSKLEYVNNQKAQIENDILIALLAAGYDDAQVVANLNIDFDKESSISENYSTPNGRDTGIEESVYHYESTGGYSDASGIPGTDSNDDTGYYLADGSLSESSTIVDEIEYAVDKTITNIEKSVGNIDYDESSIAATVIKYQEFDEDTLKASGQLDNMTYEQFKMENNEVTNFEVEEEVVELVRNATGISNVSLIGRQYPVFYDDIVSSNSFADYLPILLTILIIALLAYVVIKGVTPVDVLESEPELSVEEMLATTNEQEELNNIDMEKKSKSVKEIELFVEENPDSVAQLLRNWLSEEWEG